MLDYCRVAPAEALRLTVHAAVRDARARLVNMLADNGGHSAAIDDTCHLLHPHREVLGQHVCTRVGLLLKAKQDWWGSPLMRGPWFAIRVHDPYVPPLVNALDAWLLEHPERAEAAAP